MIMIMRPLSFSPALFLSQCLMAYFAMALTNIATDKSALLALKSQLTINSSHILSKNWSDSSSVCTWIGVTCGSRHERVAALDISKMGLLGNLPPEMGNLTFLKSLNLSRNHFSGMLPPELARLRRLQVIDFALNNFTGEIPSWFRFLPELQYLRLRNNSFMGFLPVSLSNVSKLQFLDLTFNRLEGMIPEEIGNLYNLKTLALQNNDFSGPIPKSIFNISNLETLALARNRLSGPLPRDLCFGIPRLRGLYLSYNWLDGELPSNISECSQLLLLSLLDNKFRGSIPRGIGNLRALEVLLLGNNFFTGTIPEGIGSLHNLNTLTLEYNQFSGDIPRSLSNCSKLVYIYFGGNNFSGLVPDNLGELRFLSTLDLTGNNFVSGSELSFITSLTNCRNLTRLGLSNNLFSGTLPASVGNLSTSLELFSIYNCDLHGAIPGEFGNLTNLLTLVMFGNQLQGSIPSTLGNMQNLQGLSLHGNRISGSIPGSLCRLQHVNGIMLEENLITGSIPECIRDLTALRTLNLGTNRLSSVIPASLWELRDLLELNLSSNSLTGFLPPNIGNLKSLILLDLSMNQFSGILPTSLGAMESLITFTLARNRFQESIPESVGKMLSLEKLDLSHNNLSGSIPESLEALLHLSEFDVSFNRLRGRIPSKGPFANFSSKSFISNEGLCGDPIHGVPPCRSSAVRKSKRRRILRIVYSLLGVASVVFLLALSYLFVRYRRKEKAGFKMDAPSNAMALLRLSYYDLVRATKGFNESHLLGAGGFSSVYKVILQNGEAVAVKVFNSQLEGAFRSFDTECEVLRKLRHRNLCKVVGTCSNEDFKGLVLEYMPNGSLEKWLYSEDYSLDVTQRISIMVDVACALEYLHHGCSAPTIHCDIKPSNVLLDENLVGHLSDFGISKLLGEEVSFAQTSTFATLGYIAPEYGSEGRVSTRSDVYSYGIMLMEVFTRMKPNSEALSGALSLRNWVNYSMPNDIAQIMDHNMLKPEEEFSSELLECLASIMELALNCSIESPKERISMKDVVVALKKIRFKVDSGLVRGRS